MRPSRTCSSAPEGSSASAIFSSGSWRMRSSISPTRCGPTSMLRRSTRRLPPTGSASAALDAPASRPRQRNALRSPDDVLAARHAGPLAAAGLFVLIPAGLALVALPAQQVLLVLGLTWVADTAAYFVGSRFGRRKLAPSISPSKTWEGAAGGLLGTLSYAIICAAFVPPWGASFTGAQWAAYLAGTALLCAASIVGDLFESAAKRQAGVKDSGEALPGHGGILDRIDSATSTLPLAAALLPLMAGH